jgi:hypothetical protein
VVVVVVVMMVVMMMAPVAAPLRLDQSRRPRAFVSVGDFQSFNSIRNRLK